MSNNLLKGKKGIVLGHHGGVEHVMIDANTLMSRRIPEFDEIEKLFHYAFDGRSVDF